MTTNYRELLGGPRLENQLDEAKPLYHQGEAMTEANRCIYCYDAPCVQACPTSIDIPKFIKQIAADNVRGSARTILSANMLGVSCARVCPVEELCAGACVYNDFNHQPIAIGRLQRYATETAIEAEAATGRKLFTPAEDSGRKVALVGAGPASLACAAHLALAGVKPTIFERSELPGGLNTTGVAPYKLHSEASLDEVTWLLSHGVELKTGVTVGEDVTIASLTEEYDAVFLGIGLGADRMLGFEGDWIYGATDLIRSIKNDPNFQLPEVEKVLVAGGGNTAIDVARELAMLGIPDVTLIYRRTEAEMSGYAHEWLHARQYGVRMRTGLRPKHPVYHDDKMGYFVFLDHQDHWVSVPCNMLVMATGQEKWAEVLGADIELENNGTIRVDPTTRETTRPGVYAGGDCINGGKEVVNAAADGRDAAHAMLAKWGLQPNP